MIYSTVYQQSEMWTWGWRDAQQLGAPAALVEVPEWIPSTMVAPNHC